MNLVFIAQKRCLDSHHNLCWKLLNYPLFFVTSMVQSTVNVSVSDQASTGISGLKSRVQAASQPAVQYTWPEKKCPKKQTHLCYKSSPKFNNWATNEAKMNMNELRAQQANILHTQFFLHTQLPISCLNLHEMFGKTIC